MTYTKITIFDRDKFKEIAKQYKAAHKQFYLNKLSKQLGIPKTALKHYLSNSKIILPTAENYKKICDGLGLSNIDLCTTEYHLLNLRELLYIHGFSLDKLKKLLIEEEPRATYIMRVILYGRDSLSIYDDEKICNFITELSNILNIDYLRLLSIFIAHRNNLNKSKRSRTAINEVALDRIKSDIKEYLYIHNIDVNELVDLVKEKNVNNSISDTTINRLINGQAERLRASTYKILRDFLNPSLEGEALLLKYTDYQSIDDFSLGELVFVSGYLIEDLLNLGFEGYDRDYIEEFLYYDVEVSKEDIDYIYDLISKNTRISTKDIEFSNRHYLQSQDIKNQIKFDRKNDSSEDTDANKETVKLQQNKAVDSFNSRIREPNLYKPNKDIGRNLFDIKEFVRIVNEIKDKNGWTSLQPVANLLGIDNAQIYAYCKGQYFPSTIIYKHIYEILQNRYPEFNIDKFTFCIKKIFLELTFPELLYINGYTIEDVIKELEDTFNIPTRQIEYFFYGNRNSVLYDDKKILPFLDNLSSILSKKYKILTVDLLKTVFYKHRNNNEKYLSPSDAINSSATKKLLEEFKKYLEGNRHISLQQVNNIVVKETNEKLGINYVSKLNKKMREEENTTLYPHSYMVLRKFLNPKVDNKELLLKYTDYKILEDMSLGELLFVSGYIPEDIFKQLDKSLMLSKKEIGDIFFSNSFFIIPENVEKICQHIAEKTFCNIDDIKKLYELVSKSYDTSNNIKYFNKEKIKQKEEQNHSEYTRKRSFAEITEKKESISKIDLEKEVNENLKWTCKQRRGSNKQWGRKKLRSNIQRCVNINAHRDVNINF